MDSAVEYAETTTITLEWTVRNLKHLFDSSKGESKSKVTRSIKFGGGKWQCLFYPNSGTDGGNYVSLYLSCEPTLEEKENAINGKWVREGLFKFSFELRNTSKNVLFNTKEAFDHSFSYKTANWGWAQFARRDAVYYGPNSVKSQDAFLIICTITASPVHPTSSTPAPMKSVPKDLLDAVGNLLDDPTYSDVEFILPKRGSNANHRTIWAARRVLKRAEYFQGMFETGFAEATAEGAEKLTLAVSGVKDESDAKSSSAHSDNHRHFEDSDDEDENDAENHQEAEVDSETDADRCDAPPLGLPPTGDGDEDHEMTNADEGHDNDESGPIVTQHSGGSKSCDQPSADSSKAEEIPGPKKVRVIVKDVAYTTYRAVLYYLYTDTILFAPLSSSFYSVTSPPSTTTSYSPLLPPSSSQASLILPPTGAGEQSLGLYGNGGREAIVPFFPNKSPQEKKDAAPLQQGPRTRKEWLKEWEASNPGRVLPCSAKAVYRLADKLGLLELKNRAFQHIVKSLMVTNVAYEVFSSFSATFDDVRKVQVEYFLSHWADIRGSDAMRNVWQQIRLGRHPGFEEVWPVIALNLEFKPRTSDGVGGDGRDVGMGGGEV